MDLCFGPSGSYSPFHIGIAYALRKHLDLDWDKATAYVISGGTTGLVLLLYSSPEQILDKAVGVSKIMGSLKDMKAPNLHMSKTCRTALEYLFPSNAHEILRDRVAFGVTYWPTFRIASITGSFKTKSDLIDACMASAYIPGFFLSLPPANYRSYIDGGFTHSVPDNYRGALVSTINKSPMSDLWYEKGKTFHLHLQTADTYMQIFWDGVNEVEQKLPYIESKLERLKKK